MASLKQSYLVLYNAICFCLWNYIGCLVLFSYEGGLIAGLDTAKLWTVVQPWLYVAQTLALMECVHSIAGLVKSPWPTTVMQVASRLHIVWIIWRLCPPSRSTTALATGIGAWAAVECIRYPFYGINLLTTVPYALTWLRYSAFVILYPIGIYSEVRCIWVSLSYLKSHRMLRAYPYPMPNALNFEVDLYWFYIFLLFMYIPGAVHLYTYMVKQRSSVLNAKSKTS